jgi:hypothetical protein
MYGFYYDFPLMADVLMMQKYTRAISHDPAYETTVGSTDRVETLQAAHTIQNEFLPQIFPVIAVEGAGSHQYACDERCISQHLGCGGRLGSH